MDKRPLCEITLNGTENMEWQGSVYFCTMGKQRRFSSLLELVRIVEEGKKHQTEAVNDVSADTQAI